MNTKKQSSARGDTRRKVLLQVAKKLFLEKGFDKTSVNEIVRVAGGSLATLYAMFPSKTDLFEGIVLDLRERIAEPLQLEGIMDRPVRDVLLALGQAYAQASSDPETLAVYRIIVAESARSATLRDILLSECSGRAPIPFFEYFEKKSSEGVLQIEDPKLAAGQFLGLLRGAWFFPALIGAEVDKSALEVAVKSAVDIFLQHYGSAAKT